MEDDKNIFNDINVLQNTIYAGAKTALASYYFMQFKTVAIAPIDEVIKQKVLHSLSLAVIKYSSPDKQELVNSIKNYYERQENKSNPTGEK